MRVLELSEAQQRRVFEWTAAKAQEVAQENGWELNAQQTASIGLWRWKDLSEDEQQAIAGEP